MSKDQSAEVGLLEARVEQICGRMEVLRQEFESAVAEMIASWYADQTAATITRFPAVTKALGKDGLRLLKADLAELQTQAPAIVRDVFADKRLWSHCGANNIVYRVLASTGLCPPAFDEALRLTAGRLGVTLAQVGFPVTNTSSISPELKLYLSHRGGCLFAGEAIPWSQKMTATFRQYGTENMTLERERDQLNELRRRIDTAEAEDLWRNA